MARARNIKPGFFANEKLAECDPLARLLFAGLWCLADREGRLEDRPKRIRAEVLPYDVCDADALLDQLQEHGFILRYESCEHKCIQVLNFDKHQNPHMKEAKSALPSPCADGADTESSDATPGQAPEEHCASMVHEHEEHQKSPAESGFLIPDSGSLIPDPLVVAAKPATPRKRSTTTEATRPADVEERVWNAFLVQRKAKRAPLTDIALEGIAAEAATAGISLNDAIAYCCSAGWQGFKANWYANREGSNVRPAGQRIPRQENFSAKDYGHGVEGV